MYRTEITRIIDFSETEDTLFISTDKRLISVKKTKAEAELNMFLPAEQEGLAISISSINENPNWITVKDIAHDMLRKLKSESWKEHVEQAKAINESINTIVSIMKTEIDVAKLVKR